MKWLKNLLVFLIPAAVLILPQDYFFSDGITAVEQRVIAIFLFAALSWILEPIPIYATSIIVILLELVLISDKGLVLFREGENLGNLLSYKELIGTFASPIIILFLGGFFLALAASKYKVDQSLAQILLKPFGSNPKLILLGLILITAVFSMFMSNTATTAMMLSIVAPVLALFDMQDKGRIAFALAIPLGANIGGMGSPIGTPPNAIALKYFSADNMITFGEWMMFALPYVIVMLIIGWFLLMYLFPIQKTTLSFNFKGSRKMNNKILIVYITFILTILLWVTDFIHGMNAYIVALFPVGIFLSLNIVNKEDLKFISWDVLWLVAGGIALGLALDKSGLAVHLVNSLSFDGLMGYVIVILVMLLSALMANFMSNTATANLLIPIVAVMGTAIPGLLDVGGSNTIILATALAASMGLCLPISTPPNALAFATGFIQTKFMVRFGLIMCLIGLILILGLIVVLRNVNFL